MTFNKKNCLESADEPTILKALGFRCIKPVRFWLENGESVIIKADGWINKRKGLTGEAKRDSSLRLYNVYYEKGGLETLDEFDVVGLVGESFWRCK